MVLRRLKYRISTTNLKQIATANFLSKLRYGLSVYDQAKLHHNDHQIKTTIEVQAITNSMMRTILPGKCTVREWGTERFMFI